MYEKPNPFTFEGTYKVTISGEERRLSVCENKDGETYWSLSVLVGDDDRFNYVYAVGRDSNGIEKRNLKGKEFNIYEAEGDSFWFKENELGINTIQYYLRYNENKKYLKYTLSTAAKFKDPESINNIYALEKVSDEILGECYMPGDRSWVDIKYPLTTITDSNSDIDGFGDNVVYIDADKNSECFGWYEKSSDSFIEGDTTIVAPPQFEYDNKLRIAAGKWDTNPCCLRYTVLSVAEFYDNYEYYNLILVSFKCEGTSSGGMFRSFETDKDFGECPLFVPEF